jgi:hypothetical protein
MASAEREARATRSVALFNNRYFAEVAEESLRVSNAGRDMITTRMIASASGLADSLVRPVLLRFVDAQILDKLPRAGGGRSPQYYMVLEPDLLEAISRLAPTRGRNDDATPADR